MNNRLLQYLILEATEVATSYGHAFVSTEHLLFKLMNEGPVRAFFDKIGINTEQLLDDLQDYFEDGYPILKESGGTFEITSLMKKIFLSPADDDGDYAYTYLTLLYEMCKDERLYTNYLLRKNGMEPEHIVPLLEKIRGIIDGGGSNVLLADFDEERRSESLKYLKDSNKQSKGKTKKTLAKTPKTKSKPHNDELEHKLGSVLEMFSDEELKSLYNDNNLHSDNDSGKKSPFVFHGAFLLPGMPGIPGLPNIPGLPGMPFPPNSADMPDSGDIPLFFQDPERPGMNEALRDPLGAFTENLNEKAQKGLLDPLIGRERELELAFLALKRRKKHNVVFVGEPGTGKTAIVEGIAQLIEAKKAPKHMENAVIYSLDVGSLLAGTQFRGDFEARMKAVLHKIQEIPDAILFIDEIHTIIGAGSGNSSSVDAANLLKPVISEGKVRCIGTTTYEEYKQFEKDRGLARRFQKIELQEPASEETRRILDGLHEAYGKHHKAKYSPEALDAIVELSAKYINEGSFPDKAIDIMDEVGAAAEKRWEKIKREHVEKVVAKVSRVPLTQVSKDEAQKLKSLEENLKSKIFGQDKAVEKLVQTVKISAAGLRRADKPTGSFLFTGPTGVGKTELAKQMAYAMGYSFLRFDMSEYMEKHAVSRFIGAPPGYVGYEQGGSLTDSVRKHPYSVLLLDEIEKAHPDIFNILLQIMDYAILTDNMGKKADFHNVILIMTSNAGAREMEKPPLGFAANDDSVRWKGEEALKKLFSPEFRNRLDGILTFDTLKRESVENIVRKFLTELEDKLKERNIAFSVSPAAVTWLAEKGYEPRFGARPLSRLIQTEINEKLADEILFGKLKKKSARVSLGLRKDSLFFSFS